MKRGGCCGCLLAVAAIIGIVGLLGSGDSKVEPPAPREDVLPAERQTPAVEQRTPAMEQAEPSLELPTAESPPTPPTTVPAYVWKATPESIAALIPTPQRKWGSPDGRSVLGKVTEFDPALGTLKLVTAANEVFSDFPLDRFADPDRNYLQRAAQGELAGRVVGVHDGDSLTLLVAGNTQFKIRLESIDAPEIGQEFGSNSKAELVRLAHGKEASVLVTGLDKYQRVLGWVIVDGTNANHALVSSGLAWNYVEHAKDPQLAEMELAARNGKLGLWRDWKPMPPWEWRDLQRKNAEAARAAERSRPTAPPRSGFMPEQAPARAAPAPAAARSYWINTRSGVRHNSGCRHFGNTKTGRSGSANEGRACGICGG